MNLNNIGIKPKNNNKPNTELIGDTLCIDCRKCQSLSDIKSPTCIRCMISKISEHGNPEKVKLRTSKDTKISGTVVKWLCEMATTNKTARLISKSEKSYACKNCPFSCKNMFDEAWEGFPDPYFELVRNKLRNFRPDKKNCETCLQKTYRALDQAELGLLNIKKKISLESLNQGEL